MLTPIAAAKELGVSVRTIYRYIDSGTLEEINNDGVKMVSDESIEKLKVELSKKGLRNNNKVRAGRSRKYALIKLPGTKAGKKAAADIEKRCKVIINEEDGLICVQGSKIELNIREWEKVIGYEAGSIKEDDKRVVLVGTKKEKSEVLGSKFPIDEIEEVEKYCKLLKIDRSEFVRQAVRDFMAKVKSNTDQESGL